MYSRLQGASFRYPSPFAFIVDVSDVSWSPDSRFLCSCSVDCQILVWSLEKETSIHKLEGHSAWISCVSWDPLGAVTLSALADSVVHRFREQGQHVEGVVDGILGMHLHIHPAPKRQVRQRSVQVRALVSRRHHALRHTRRLRAIMLFS